MYWCRTLGELALCADSSQAVPPARGLRSLERLRRPTRRPGTAVRTEISTD
jgi:hypothetical protein